jgi:hypothetical protein
MWVRYVCVTKTTIKPANVLTLKNLFNCHKRRRTTQMGISTDVYSYSKCCLKRKHEISAHCCQQLCQLWWTSRCFVGPQWNIITHPTTWSVSSAKIQKQEADEMATKLAGQSLTSKHRTPLLNWHNSTEAWEKNASKCRSVNPDCTASMTPYK